MAFFEAARNLYTSFGFVPCPPFGSYKADPNSVFMTMQLTELAPKKSFKPNLLRSVIPPPIS